MTTKTSNTSKTSKMYNESYEHKNPNNNKFEPFIIWDNGTTSKNSNTTIYSPIELQNKSNPEVPNWDNLPPLVSPIKTNSKSNVENKPNPWKANTNPWKANTTPGVNTNAGVNINININKKKTFAEILKEKPNKSTQVQKPNNEPIKITNKSTQVQKPNNEPIKITNNIVVSESKIITPKPCNPNKNSNISWADLEDSDYESEDE